MKPEGLALDIVVVGLGQAGGNIAAEFYRRGYRALALNTAQTDLVALDPGGVYPTMPADRRVYIGIDGYDGAGADPSYGRDCIIEHAERIRTAILKQAASADVVILAAGLGGGTGSAIAELIRVLKSEEIPLVALATLPTEGESGIAKVNAVRAINELVESHLLGWIFIDNARIGELNQDVSVVDYFAHVNGQIAAPIDALNRLNDREDLTAIRSFDGEDFRKLILSSGVLNYGVAELQGISTDEVVGRIKECIESSELMPAGFDMGRLSYVGVVLEASEAMLAETPISVFEEIHEQLKLETGGAAVYRGIYRANEGATTPTLRLIAASQSLPHRMREVLADAKREGEILGEKIREQLPVLELGAIEGFELFKTPRNNPSSRPRRTSASARALDLEEPFGVNSSSRAAALREGLGAPSPLSARETRDPARESMREEDEQPSLRRELGPELKLSDPRPSGGLKRRPVRSATTTRPAQPTARASGTPAPKEVKAPASLSPAPKTESPQPVPSKAPTLDVGGRPAKESAPRERPTPPSRRPAAPAHAEADDEEVPDQHEAATGEIEVSAELAQAVMAREVSAADVELGTGGGAIETDVAVDEDGDLKPRRRPPHDEPTATLPSPEAYTRLVGEYSSAKQQKVRDEIARRLEQDSMSPHTVVRYYAVEAMSKLGRDTFGAALLAATEDENEAVRAIAVESLRK